jgi:CRP-like cAMP-binding protein
MAVTTSAWPAPELLGPAVEYPRDMVLYRQGGTPSTLFLIDAGIVKLVRATSDGGRVVSGFRGSPWLLGSASAIRDRSHPRDGCRHHVAASL